MKPLATGELEAGGAVNQEGGEILDSPGPGHDPSGQSRPCPDPKHGWPEFVDGLDAVLWEAVPTTLRFTYVSRGAERILGYPVRRWLEEPDFWVRVVHPEDRTAVARSQALARAGDDHHYDCRVLHRDGHVRWFRNRVRIVRDGEGRVSLLRGTMVEITELKEGEVALRAEEERYRLLSEHVLDLVSLHGPDGRLLYVSPAIRELTGYEPDELVGKRLDAFAHPEDLSEILLALRNVVEGRASPAVVFRVVRKGGGIRWCEAKGSRVLPEDGRGEVRVVCVTRDISERRVLQEELARAQRIEALGRLAGGIAHDFNNLLTVIQGHLEFLRHGIPDHPELAEDLDDMERAVRRAGLLTRQLMTVGRHDLTRPRVVDLSTVVRDIEQLLRRLLPENIRFEALIPVEPISVRLDPAQFEQVLVNMVVNARDAMQGGGLLEIELLRKSVGEVDLARMHGIQPGPYAVCRVSDTGEGMDPSTMARIFEPFFTTKGVDQGSGLGLAMVYGVVQQSGGHVLVESARGAGTTFRIWLPLVEDPTRIPGDHEPESAPSTGPGETVLLVEDEANVRALVVSVLERAGHRAIVTASMEEALAAFLRYQGRVGLLLSQAVFPRGTGLELGRRLRHDRPGLPIVLMADPADRGRDGEAESLEDATAVVSRPFTAESLLSAVRRALNTDA